MADHALSIPTLRRLFASALVALAFATCAAAPAAADQPARGWYVQPAGKFQGAFFDVEKRKIRVADVSGIGGGRCVDAQGDRRKYDVLLPKPWALKLKRGSKFKGADAGPSWMSTGKDRFRQRISGRISGDRIVGTFSNEQYWSAEGRGSDFPERCRAKARFEAELTWPQKAKLTGETAQGRQITIETGSFDVSIGGGSSIPVKDFYEPRVKSIRTSLLAPCTGGAPAVEIAVDVGSMILDGGSAFFDPGFDLIEIEGRIEGSTASGVLTGSRELDEPPYEFCDSGRVAFSAGAG